MLLLISLNKILYPVIDIHTVLIYYPKVLGTSLSILWRLEVDLVEVDINLHI